eukprot:s1789_g3.t1
MSVQKPLRSASCSRDLIVSSLKLDLSEVLRIRFMGSAVESQGFAIGQNWTLSIDLSVTVFERKVNSIFGCLQSPGRQTYGQGLRYTLYIQILRAHKLRGQLLFRWLQRIRPRLGRTRNLRGVLRSGSGLQELQARDACQRDDQGSHVQRR